MVSRFGFKGGERGRKEEDKMKTEVEQQLIINIYIYDDDVIMFMFL